MLSRRASTRRALVALGAVSVLAACASTPLGASEANLSTAKSKASEGASLYASNCARCHGDRGQGRSAPQLMGAGALPKYPRDASDSGQQFTDPQEIQLQVQTRAPGTPSREPFVSAGDVFSFISTQMPPGNKAGSLKPEEYWAILNFILAAHGIALPETGVTPQNASSVSLESG